MSGVESGRARTAGLVLIALGIVVLLVSFMHISITNTVIDSAFVLEAGEKYGWHEDGARGTRYHTPRGTIPVLEGKVSVEGEGIYLSVRGIGYNMENVFVDTYFNFTIDHAGSDFYFLTFDNTNGDAESRVEFALYEMLTGSPLQLFLWSSSLPLIVVVFFYLLEVFLRACLLPVGCTLIIRDIIRRRRRARLRRIALMG